MQMTVLRGDGDRQGENIVDELLYSESFARGRGKREINRAIVDRVRESCQCPKHNYIATGSLARVTESDRRWSGVVRYFSLTLTLDEANARFTADTRLEIERVA